MSSSVDTISRMRFRFSAAAVTLVLLIAGCGGSHKSSSSSTTSSSSSAAKHKSSHGKSAGAHKALSQLINVAKSGAGPSANATATTGDAVQFVTRVPGKPGSKAAPVHLDFTQNGPKWTVTASANKQQSTATLTSKSGKALPLSGLHYGCSLPPAPTYCPVSNVHNSKGHIQADFSASPTTPITIGATVGPVANALPAPPHSTLIAPTYDLQMTVAAVPKNHSKSSTPVKPGATASVHPGDMVTITVRLRGGVVGATQPVTVSFGQGPAKTIPVSASVPGGTPSKATLSSAAGSPMAIVLPRYNCGLPPSPTFCPPSRIVAASHTYTLTIDASPKTPPIIIQTTAQGG